MGKPENGSLLVDCIMQHAESPGFYPQYPINRNAGPTPVIQALQKGWQVNQRFKVIVLASSVPAWAT